jgi:FtsP/CotA-like multicopper oxidase with cupredoxin domain
MGRRHFIAAIVLLGSALAFAQAEKVIDIALTNGKAPADEQTLRVSKGDKVVLRWKSDRQIALHLHGYDIEASVPAQGTSAMSFTASLPGRFPVSEHTHGPGHHRAVLYLEVHP